MPKNNGYDNWMNVGGDFLDYVDTGKKKSSNDFMSYIDSGMNYGDYTEKPKGKGGNRRGRPRISNNPNEFGISLQALGDSVMHSEIQAGNAIRHGTKGRKARKERYKKEKQADLKRRGLKEGPTLGRTIYEKVKLAHNKRRATNQLKKYYHPKPKKEREEKQEELQRYKNQGDMR